MATLKHQQLADKEFQQKEENEQFVLPEERPTASEIEKQPEVYNIIFKLVKKKRGRIWIDNCCDNVINPKTNRPERIWLLNGANSIWDSELEHILRDKNRYERARRGMDVLFEDGICRVTSTDVLKLEFLRLNKNNCGKRRNGSGKYDFYEYNPAEEAKERHRKQLLKIEMVIKAKEMAIDKAKMLASFLGISFVDEIGVVKPDDGIRTELMVKADSAPETFQKYLDSKEVEISWLIRQALVSTKIDTLTQAQEGNAIWAKGGGFIAKIPQGRKAHEYLTELAMTNSDEGRAFLERLKALT